MVFHFPPISGGGVIVAVELANSLVKSGNQVTVITPDLVWDGQRYDPKINPSIRVIRVDTPSKSKIKIAARRCKGVMEKEAINIGKKTKFDFILTIFHPFHLVPSAAVNASKKLKVPVLVKIDDATYTKSSKVKSIQRKFEKYYLSKTLKNASSILVPNKETGDTVSAVYNVDQKKIAIVPNGVDLSKFYSSKSSKRHTVVFSGVMYHHRGVDVLLNAAVAVSKKVPDVEFLMIGDGPEMKNLKKIVREKNLQNVVNFIGWIERDKIPEYLAKSAVGIGPLRSTDVTKNALPIKVLEYMASSLPIIAMKHTLPSDVLEDNINGYFINNKKELAEKIIVLLTDEQKRQEMGMHSNEMAKRFDWKNITNLIIQEYNRIIKT